MNRVHFSSQTDLWETPQYLFDWLNARFHFTVDACATKNNAKCERFFTEKEDGLEQDWRGERVFMNPPYSQIGPWVKRAYESSLGKGGATVVCLIPARTDTEMWHRFVTRGVVEFLKGRLNFNGHDNPAPFPSCVVVFGDESPAHKLTKWDMVQAMRKRKGKRIVVSRMKRI
jgi:phage N-6-adenine-methyltransferase